jgi:hypothetical protein
MTITIEVAPEVQAELARQAAQQGVEVDAYAASLLEEAAHRPMGTDAPPQEVIDAVERLKTFGKTHGLSLGGMTIRELRDEARP